MKKVFKFTETRSWYFELDVDEGAQVEEALSALVGTEGFNYGLTEPILKESSVTFSLLGSTPSTLIALNLESSKCEKSR